MSSSICGGDNCKNPSLPCANRVGLEFAENGNSFLFRVLHIQRLLVDPGPAGVQVKAGDPIAVVGNTGGFNALAADAAEAAGLHVPDLSGTVDPAGTVNSVDPAGTVNPVDLGAEATPEAVAAAVTALARRDTIDAVVVTFVATRTNDVPGTLRALARAVDAVPGGIRRQSAGVAAVRD